MRLHRLGGLFYIIRHIYREPVKTMQHLQHTGRTKNRVFVDVKSHTLTLK